MNITALVVAAGRGVRAGGDLPKQYQLVAGVPLLRHAIMRLLAHPAITAVRIVINPDDRALHDAAVAGLAVGDPILGGSTRQASARAGLEALAADPPGIVMVHDAARAFVPASVIDALLAALDDPRNDGAVPGMAVVDSLRRGTGHYDSAVARDDLWRVQTPQAFRFPALLAAHRA